MKLNEFYVSLTPYGSFRLYIMKDERDEIKNLLIKNSMWHESDHQTEDKLSYEIDLSDYANTVTQLWAHNMFLTKEWSSDPLTVIKKIAQVAADDLKANGGTYIDAVLRAYDMLKDDLGMRETEREESHLWQVMCILNPSA